MFVCTQTMLAERRTPNDDIIRHPISAGLSIGKYFGAMIDFVYVLLHGYFVPNTR